MLLAIGKGSGSFEIWLCDIASREFDKLGSYDAHYYVVSSFPPFFLELLEGLRLHSYVDFCLFFYFLQVTGLAWALGGRFLYSCSQVIFFSLSDLANFLSWYHYIYNSNFNGKKLCGHKYIP